MIRSKRSVSRIIHPLPAIAGFIGVKSEAPGYIASLSTLHFVSAAVGPRCCVDQEQRELCERFVSRR